MAEAPGRRHRSLRAGSGQVLPATSLPARESGKWSQEAAQRGTLFPRCSETTTQQRLTTDVLWTTKPSLQEVQGKPTR